MTEYLTQKIARYPLIVVAILIVTIMAIATGLLQAIGRIDILANLTDVWLFFAVFPSLSLAAAFIVKELDKRGQQDPPFLRDMQITNRQTYIDVGHLREITYVSDMLTKDLDRMPEVVQSDRKRLLEMLASRRDAFG